MDQQQKFFRRLRLAALISACCLAQPAWADAPGSSPLVSYINRTQATGSNGTFFGFDFDPATNTFWTVNAGTTQAIRRSTSTTAPIGQINYYDSNGYWQPSANGAADWTSFDPLTNAAWQDYSRSSSLTNNGGNGTTSTTTSSLNVLGNGLLNPAPLTINGTTYPANSVMIVLDAMSVGPSSAPLNSQAKIVYAYDLRTVDVVAGQNTGRDWNSNTVIDWNDVFDTIVTRQDFMDKLGYTNPTDNNTNVARNFTFSATDPKYIYLTDIQTDFGGVWRVDLTKTGPAALTRVMNVTADQRIFNELNTVATTQKRFDPFTTANGDQILVFGSSANGAGVTGGLSYVLHDLTSNTTSNPNVIFHGSRISGFTGLDSTTSNSAVVMKSDGTFYFTDTTSAILKMDTQGRVSKVIATEQRRSITPALGATSANTAFADLQLRSVTMNNGAGAFDVDEIMFTASETRTPLGALAFDPADLNRDGLVNATDTGLFIQEFDRAVSTGSPLLRSNVSTYQGYLNADLNGSARVNTAGTGLEVAAVDNRDLLTLFQFINKKAGDANLDGQIDAADQAILTENLGTSGNWLKGDFNRDGMIDAADQALLTANFGPANDYSLAGFDPQGKLVGSTGLWADVQKAGSEAIDADTNLVISKSAGSTTQGPTANTAAVYIDLGTNETGGPANMLNLVSGVRVDLLEGMLVRPNGVLNTTGATLRLGVEGYAATLAVLDGGQLNGNLNLEGSLDFNTSGTATFNGTIKNNGSTPSSFTKTGAGQLDITAPHTYTGVTSVAGGTLRLTAANLIPDASPVTVAVAGTLNLNGYSETVGSLAGAGAVQFGSTAGTTLTTGGLNTNTSFSGVISGTGNLVKQGTGIFTLSSTTGNTYLGDTTINGGTISVSNNIQLGATSSTVTLNGGTLRSSASGTAFSSARPVDVTATGGSIEVSNASATATFSGPVNNQGALNKIGNGTATFSGAQTMAAGAAVNVNAGTLNLNPTNNATLGAGANATVASGATLNLGGPANALSNGSTIHADITNSGTLAATTAGKRVGNIGGTGTTTVTAAGATLTANHIQQTTLNIGAGNSVTIAVDGTNSGTSKVTALNINGTGKLDLTNNDLIVDNGNLTAVTALLASGLDISGSYGNGPGITSSAFASNLNFNTVLGIAPNSELNFTSFSGQAVDANDLLIKYTYFGDADLSGSVDTSTDFDLYITGLTSSGSQGGWLYGDFDYSGTVDSSTDFDLYITGLTSQTGTLLTVGGGSNQVQAVPEPGPVGLMGVGVLGGVVALLRRRRMLTRQEAAAI